MLSEQILLQIQDASYGHTYLSIPNCKDPLLIISWPIVHGIRKQTKETV